MRKKLSNKPLIEAVFELKWELQKSPTGGQIDPHYKILVGMLYDKLKDYPVNEPLPSANMPDEMAAYMVQNRFRAGKGEWPVVQIGPGIITVNDTKNYTWEEFERRILEVLEILIDIYPNPEKLTFNSLSLRYIDSIDVNFDEEDISTFLKEKMHTNIKFYEKLFEQTGVKNLPMGFDLTASFSSTKPIGAVILRLARGKVDNVPKLILDTMVVSLKEDVPKDKDKIPQWIKEAHDLTSNWFFKLVEGELLRRFE